MLKSYLEEYMKTNRLYNSWLIQTSDPLKTLADLESFISINLLKEKIPFENHPDFKLIEKSKSGVGSKNIVVEQIRGLQEFLNKTAAISDYKVGVIKDADLMNPNAANSCLKMLEDTPLGSYIFLISRNSANILPTIKSRCINIEIRKEDQELTDDNYTKYISLLLKNNIDLRLNFLSSLGDKDKELWRGFSEAALNFLAKTIKKSAGMSITLNEIEEQVVCQFKSTSAKNLIKKFDDLNELINNTNIYDLDLKASYVLIINFFES